MMKWSEMGAIQRDVLVATRVMGWSHVADSEHWAIGWNGNSIHHATREKPVRAYKDFRPSTDIAAAWEVVEKLCPTANKSEPWFKLITNSGKWECDFHRGTQPTLTQSAPEAICLAALRAVGVEIE